MSDTGRSRGFLIALEGGEGCGKSTQARLLAEELGAVLTREPGGTEVGDRIRTLLLESDLTEISPVTELLLVTAARAEHVREVVEPALAAGSHVVTDRFSGSSLAYQGYGRGLDLDVVASVNRVATGGLDPDLNVLLDVPTDVARARLDRSLDRIEQAGAEFHERVNVGFRNLAGAGRWVVVDGEGAPEDVAIRVATAVRERLFAGVTGRGGR